MSTNDSHDDHSTRGEDSRTELQPAPKRRRTLAGSILTTALSAALIGTAVGLTMYRLCVLWADRGHDHHERLLPPPPSYQEATANSNNHDNDSSHNKGPSTRPGTPIQSGKAQPSTPRHRKPRLRGNLARKNARTLRPIVHHSFHHHDRRTSVSSAGPATPTSTVQPEFDFSSMRIESSFNDDHEDERMEEDDDSEMSLIGDRIAALINEGKRALGREVVVSSERPEDEMDDGAGDWVEDDGSSPTVPHPFPLPAKSAISRANSGNGGTKRRPSSLSATQAAGFSPVHRATLSASSPRRSRVDSFGGGRRSLGGPFERNDSVDSVRSRREDEGEWESPELREFMRKARESRGLA